MTMMVMDMSEVYSFIQQFGAAALHTQKNEYAKSMQAYVGKLEKDLESSNIAIKDLEGEFKRRNNQTSPRKRDTQSSKGDQSSSGIIKFLNATVPKFSKKGSIEIANHLELYESTVDSLQLYADADRIRFLPWAFENRYRHYFTSFRERGIRKWQDVLHEVKMEFGPFKSIMAARRDIYKLRCKPNQSPREFLYVQNAYGLAYSYPDWESCEFKQFYDAMPVQIKFSLARDLDAPLDRLVTAATTLYNISECNPTGERSAIDLKNEAKDGVGRITPPLTKRDGDVANMLFVLQSNQKEVSPKVGVIECNRDEVSPEVLTCQRDYSLKKRQMREHPNYLCDLFNDDGRYYIDSYLQDECIGPIKGLIDTGSQATILSFNYFQQIVDRTEKKPKLKAFDGSLISVGGDTLQVKGTAWLKFTIGKKIIRHPTIIVDIPNDKLIIGVDILKRLSSIIDFINEAIWTQVKAPIAYDRSCNIQTHYNCHVVEERPNFIEVHFRNNQIPDITILKNGDPEKAIRDTKQTITIQKDRIKKVTLNEDVLTILLKGRCSEVADLTRHTQSMVRIEKVSNNLLIPIQMNNMARMKYGKLDLKSEASYISLSLLKQVANPKMIKYSSPQGQWVHDLDGDSQSHNVIARCLLSISIGDKTTEHSFIVLNEPRHQMYIGNDLLHRFAAQVDLVNNNLWSRLSGDPEGCQNEEQTLKWGQQMPYALSILASEDVKIPEGECNNSDLSSEEGTCHIEETSLVFNHESDEKEYELYQLKKEMEQAAEQISLADARSDESKPQQLKKLFIDFQDMFAKDSYDCGVTDLHVARIQTDPNAPPVYVKQYRLPLATFESLV
ncbi:LOW QUALITY PROTEIN: uncharacterized protein PAF06_003919 [Gastrophryne carolinensis]